MKIFTIAVLFLLTLLSCEKKGSNRDEHMSTVVPSSEPVELINKQKNIHVVYHSIDGGINWLPFDNGITGDATVSSFLVIDNRIFASTDHNGIYFIKGDQEEWKRIDENLPDGIDINAISAINNLLIIGTLRHGVMISRDNGKNWDFPINQINSAIRCLYAKDNILFAGADNGIYKSLDNGSTWAHIWKGVQVNGFAGKNEEIYGALMNGAVSTSDEGKNWRYVYEPHTLHDISTDGQRTYAMTLGDGLRRSENEGLTWENANAGLGAKNLYTFEVKRFANKLYAAQWYGVYTSDNWGTNWRLIKNGLPDSTAFTTLEITKRGLIAGIGLRKN
jgi:hypothetical protein